MERKFGLHRSYQGSFSRSGIIFEDPNGIVTRVRKG